MFAPEERRDEGFKTELASEKLTKEKKQSEVKQKENNQSAHACSILK